jgi:hypothetical protein
MCSGRSMAARRRGTAASIPEHRRAWRHIFGGDAATTGTRSRLSARRPGSCEAVPPTGLELDGPRLLRSEPRAARLTKERRAAVHQPLDSRFPPALRRRPRRPDRAGPHRHRHDASDGEGSRPAGRGSRGPGVSATEPRDATPRRGAASSLVGRDDGDSWSRSLVERSGRIELRRAAEVRIRLLAFTGGDRFFATTR